MVEYRISFDENILHCSKYLKSSLKTKKNKDISIFFTDLCQECIKLSKIMSSIPQGMFAAKKLRENREKVMTVSRMSVCDSNNSKKYFNTKLTELTPLKYNSKLMNSIWGLYNRYSPHNIKSTVDETSNAGDLQQYVANLPKLSATKDTADGMNKVQNQNNVPNFENLWKTIPISQSN
ncbi:uncharacterized protein LOC143918202 [Arctopsyche grandis]|uniref:uncharacterized protein LOC143918202 n=1 Tax=Arctopsyche grandis TaxID=121162 RepID=UPI00406D7C70